MKEAEPLSSKESSEVKIEFSQTISSDNINEYNDIKPLPLPEMKNIHQFIMNCVKNEEYCYSFIDFMKKFYHFRQIRLLFCIYEYFILFFSNKFSRNV